MSARVLKLRMWSEMQHYQILKFLSFLTTFIVIHNDKSLKRENLDMSGI